MDFLIDFIAIPFLLPLVTTAVSYFTERSTNVGEVVLRQTKQLRYQRRVLVLKHVPFFFLNHALWGLIAMSTAKAAMKNGMVIYICLFVWSVIALFHLNLKDSTIKSKSLHACVLLLVVIFARFLVYKLHSV